MDKKALVILGANGQGKVAADIAKKTGYEDIVFLDDDENVKECASYKVVGKTSIAPTLGRDVFIAIGNPSVRERMAKENRLVSLIHPNAVIAEDVVIEEGSIVMAGAVINPGAVIKKGAIINTCSSVDHDCVIEEFVHVAVGAHVAGTCHIGKSTWIGAGATISNNVNICEGCMIGAGAVVVKDINEAGTYVGVPARKIR